MKKLGLIGCFIVVVFLRLNAQVYEKDGFGITGGLQLNLGTHFQTLGIQINTFYFTEHIQLNSGYFWSFNKSSKIVKDKYFKNKIYLGVKAHWGRADVERFVMNEVSLNSASSYGVGYFYSVYLDNRGTSQNSGGFDFHIRNIDISTENDLFAGFRKDQFRTGAAQIGFHYREFYFAGITQLYTGETKSQAIIKDSEYFSKGGYKDLSTSFLGNYSQGILAARIVYNAPFGQNIRMDIGVDDEYIRHIFQNRMIHDLGNALRIYRPHYPVMNQEGHLILNKAEWHSRRPPYFYFQFGGNLAAFY